jgi:uncharacterized protein YndB with AHSA1/START domain
VRPEHAITINRKIGASFETAYAAYTQPERMREWMGEVEADVRAGGRYRIRVVEGGAVYVHSGMYDLLEPPRRIVMTFSATPEGARPPASPAQTNMFVELRFIPLGDAETEIWLLYGWDGDDLDYAAAKAVEAAWTGWLDRLDAYVRSERGSREPGSPA